MAFTRGRAFVLAPLLGAAVATTAQASPPPAAAPQPTTERLRIVGPHASSYAGTDVRALGDVNGDGQGDLLVVGHRMTAWVVYGRAGSGTVDLASLGPAGGFSITLSADPEKIGQWAAPAGDVNGDRRADVLVGDAAAEQAFVLFGGAHHGAVQLPAMGPNGGVRIDNVELRPPLPVETFSVDGAGDVNRDGFADVALGAPGRLNAARDDYEGGVYVIFGRPSGGIVDAHALGSRGFTIADSPGQFLSHAAGVGDANGDGLGDVLVGAGDTVSDNGGTSSGRVHLVFGSRSSATVNTGSLGTRGFSITQSACCLREGSGFGTVLGRAGDVNRDGLADLLVSSPLEHFGESYTWIVFGSRSRATVDVYGLGRRGIALFGATKGAAAGDADGDGYDDVAVLRRAGGSALIWGRPTADAGSVSVDDLEGDGLAFTAGGTAIAGLPGAGEVLIGNWPADPLGREDAGQASVLDLPDPRAGCTLTGTPGSNTLTGTAGDDVICGLGGNDTVYGGGGSDRIDGGPGNDVLFGGVGDDRVVGGPGADRPNGSAHADVLVGATGADLLTGGDGNDVALGGTGHDKLVGGAGNDRLDGGADGDTLFGEAGDDALAGGLFPGVEKLRPVDAIFGSLDGGTGDDDLVGGDREKRLVGGDGADAITGSVFGDFVSAGAGPDTIHVEGDRTFDEVLDRLVLVPDDVRCGTGADEVTFDDLGTSAYRDRPAADCEVQVPVD